MSPPGILIAADDRTGALEVAGVAAHALGAPVPVVVGVEQLDRVATGSSGVVVVDTATRHLSPAAARRRARELDPTMATRQIHKIDSTLRGNWAHELVARHGHDRRAVLVVPALPAQGRTCENGIVLVDGRPVADRPADATGPRSAPLASSRPSDLLRAAGAPSARELTHRDVAGWVEAPVGFAVCDARDDTELDRAVSALRGRPDVLLAGTSAVAAVVGRDVAETSSRASPRSTPVRPTAASCLVVCGSMHPAARAQVAAAAARGARVVVHDEVVHDEVVHDEMVTGSSGTVILVPPPATPEPERREAPAAVAASLAERVEELYVQLRPDALVVIGGDTAAAVLRDGPVHVGGLVEPGAPWAMTADGRFVVTRAGGFGDRDALHRLVRATLGP